MNANAKQAHYTKEHVGCWADGALGHGHVRWVLGNLVEPFDPELSKSLHGEWPDDLADEEDALQILDEVCDGVAFVFEGGDLLLIESEEDLIHARDSA